MTLLAEEKKSLGKREGGEQTNCHSSGAKYASKESDAKGIKEKMTSNETSEEQLITEKQMKVKGVKEKN